MQASNISKYANFIHNKKSTNFNYIELKFHTYQKNKKKSKILSIQLWWDSEETGTLKFLMGVQK